MELPIDLRTAIDGELASLSSRKLAISAADLSKRYRTERVSKGETFMQSDQDVEAYAAFRMPATFAAVYSALKQAKDRTPNWSPQTLLDVGAGPGTAMWAAASIWPELKSVTLLEREEGMMALGKRLATYSPLDTVSDAKWLKVNIIDNWEETPKDLIILSYVLGELPQSYGTALIQKLWELTSGMLLIIEPGTPAGFSRIKKAREQLMEVGAKTIAPCPHNKSCPMTEDNWCHFAQRISRSRLHRQVKSAELAYEDEKFSFVCVSRMPGVSIQGMVIRHPQVRSGHIHLELCTPEGLTGSVVTRKNRELFRSARNLHWGSAIALKDD